MCTMPQKIGGLPARGATNLQGEIVWVAVKRNAQMQEFGIAIQ